MGSYLIVLLVAVVVTYSITPLVLAAARRIGAVDIPDDRKVHAVPTPTLGGTALLLGFLASMGAASLVEPFVSSFRPFSLFPPTELIGITAGTLLIYVLGVLDDLRGLKAPAKFSGQILAAGLVFLSGVRLEYFRFPGLGALSLSPDISAIATIIWFVALVNAVNFVDGLDGLAAGITAIAAATFFVHSYQLSEQGLAGPEPTAPLISIAIVGTTLGFLRYNFNPAKIFMGDSGSMTLGFLLAAATVVGVGRSAPQNPGQESVVFYLPLVIPLIVLAVPILDTLVAIVRRARKRRPIFHADKEHMHHRLLEIGHGHRQAVLIMYMWSAAVGGLTLTLSIVPNRIFAILFLALALGLFLYTLFPRIVRFPVE